LIPSHRSTIDEPILVLNGVKERGARGSPINSICFPSVVCSDYSPRGSHLCSVSILEKSLEEYDGKDDELDVAVRRQLSSWFPSHTDAIIDPDTWRLKRIELMAHSLPNSAVRIPPTQTTVGTRHHSEEQSYLEVPYVCSRRSHVYLFIEWSSWQWHWS